MLTSLIINDDKGLAKTKNGFDSVIDCQQIYMESSTIFFFIHSRVLSSRDEMSSSDRRAPPVRSMRDNFWLKDVRRSKKVKLLVSRNAVQCTE